MKSINLRRTHLTLRPDPGRVLARPLNLANEERARTIARRVMALPEAEVHALLEQVQAEFGDRHPETRAFLKRRSLIRGQQLIIPYAMSDYATTFATVSLDEVLEGMQ